MSRLREEEKDEIAKRAVELIWKYGSDILKTDTMQSERSFMQHGKVSVYEHSLFVAYHAVYKALKKRLAIDYRSLIRGALLHDYFLYDWHKVGDRSHRLHGFRHARRAKLTAMRDFDLNDKEMNIIDTHMWPLNMRWPKYRESFLVTLADKKTAWRETFHKRDMRMERALRPLLEYRGGEAPPEMPKAK